MSSLKEFLLRADRLEAPVLLFAPKVDIDRVTQDMEQVFGSRHVFVLRSTGPIAPTEHDVEEVFLNSFEGGGVLAVLLNDRAPATVVQAVSRMCDDGVFAYKRDGAWRHDRPPHGWRLVVVAEVAEPGRLPGSLGGRFSAVMAL